MMNRQVFGSVAAAVGVALLVAACESDSSSSVQDNSRFYGTYHAEVTEIWQGGTDTWTEEVAIGADRGRRTGKPTDRRIRE